MGPILYAPGMLTYHRLKGEEARQYLDDLSSLRLKVFREFPYLYEGSPEYERQYLETYFKANHSFIFLVEDKGKIVGATTGILASEEEESFRKPIEDYGLNPSEVFYFGESVLLHDYRGRGLGKKNFAEREAYARKITGVKILSFCAVERSFNHPLKPSEYRPLDKFWNTMGFTKKSGLTTTYQWRDRDRKDITSKNMQFWIKQISRE